MRLGQASWLSTAARKVFYKVLKNILATLSKIRILPDNEGDEDEVVDMEMDLCLSL